MYNPMSLENKTIIVTGAGQGIGRAIAHSAILLGGRVVAMDRNPETLAEFEREAATDRLITAAGDVTDGEFVNATVDMAANWTGSLEGLVNNAGISRAAMIHKSTPSRCMTSGSTVSRRSFSQRLRTSICARNGRILLR